jgi:hypothetical protein
VNTIEDSGRRPALSIGAAQLQASGEPATDATGNAVIGVLAGVLRELGTPPATLVTLATSIAAIRAAIVSEPGVPAR